MSAFVDAAEHCEAMSQEFSDLSETYDNINTYFQQKLWHQLTLLVLEFLSKPKTNQRACSKDKNTFWALYNNVVLTIANKLDSLAVGRMAAEISFAQPKEDFEASKKLLDDLLAKDGCAAATKLYVQSKLGLLTMTQTTPSKEAMASIYETIKTNAPLLNQLVPDTPEAIMVNAAHYETSVTYYKIVGPPEAFYEEAICYLNYYQPTEDDALKSHALAVDLCLAALTGEGVYNLGQVVTNPILQVLKGTPEGWLVDLLQACAQGNVPEFKTLCQKTYPSQIASQPALVNLSQQMQEKMTLLALVQMVFERKSSERTLEFTEIATRLEIPADQVEWVIMRAFSVKLMEGCMDQVEGSVHVTWILPRILTPDQMADLASRFGDWATKVGKTKEYMQEQTPTMLAT
jgi:26S proteasome regulatory subunit N9